MGGARRHHRIGAGTAGLAPHVVETEVTGGAVLARRAAATVIVVNYNGGEYLARCVAALQTQTFTRFKVVVVDNASMDGSFQLARGMMEDFRFEFRALSANIGFAAANNAAARGVETEWLATLNPDAFPMSTWLERLMDATQQYPDADMFGSTQVNAANPTQWDGIGDVYSFLGLFWRGGQGQLATAAPANGEIFSPCAAAALYRTAAFHEAGGFDERFFCYGEDVDLGFRLRLRGSRAIRVADAVVHHVDGASTGGRRSEFARYHSVRNRVWLFVKNMPGPLFWLLAPGHLACNLWFLAKALPARHRRAVWRGFRDALAGLPQTVVLRREIQAARRVPVSCIARALCWSPRHLWTGASHQILPRPGVG
jgi:N-acetylglucosaminyl-diphospho-decaprenol L-rhamnosyltransferase